MNKLQRFTGVLLRQLACVLGASLGGAAGMLAIIGIASVIFSEAPNSHLVTIALVGAGLYAAVLALVVRMWVDPLKDPGQSSSLMVTVGLAVLLVMLFTGLKSGEHISFGIVFCHLWQTVTSAYGLFAAGRLLQSPPTVEGRECER